MRQWLLGRTLFQKIALVLILLALGAVILSALLSGSSRFGLLLLALIIGYIAFRKELLWRMRNRLLVAYILFGVVPIFLMAFGLTLTTELLVGQIATQRVRQDLEARVNSVRSAAQNLTLAASHGAKADVLEGIRQVLPNLEMVVQVNGDALRLPSDGQFQAAPAWIAPGFSGLLESGEHYFIGANAGDKNVQTFAYVPLDRLALASITPGVVSVPEVLRGNVTTIFYFGLSGNSISVDESGVRREIVPAGLEPPRGWWDVPVAGLLAWKVQSSSGTANVFLPLISRPSLLLAGVATGRFASMMLSMLLSVGCFLFILEAFSVFSTVRLSWTITQSVDDLYRGTLQVGQGDFSCQIPVRGRHQLSELASSFNTMTAKIRQLIGEVKKKEKLDAELEIAKEVQEGLFPKSAPKLKTLEVAAICIPGRVVSGDYYDYLRLDDRWTAIALADVSGKGVSAALLMASLQSALHAQLKFNGASSNGSFSTATLMARISQQLYENTPPEKYATFFCSAYDDETGRLIYTNAGHLSPILVRDGKAIRLDGGGMVAGLIPDLEFEQQDVFLRTGDLLAMFSDGISEAMDAAQQEFGADRLADVLLTQTGKSLENIIAAVTSTVEKWIHDPEGRDDLTLVLLRRL
jgi:sigma-B regulation protein RsbU (phosphoserine phosphatase)